MTQSLDERLGLPSASSWRRYELCAGSFQLEQEARRLNQLAHESSPAAQRGELIHAWLAGVPDADGNEIKLDDSEQQTADFLQERMQGEVRRIFGDQPVQQSNEKRYWLVINGRKMLSGRVDRVVYTDTVALVQEAKTGWAEPDPAEQNAQLKVLAVLVALNLPRTLREVVVQLCSGPYGVTEARYDYPALAKAYNDILTTLKAIQNPLAPLNPSLEACRYCPATLICGAVKNLVLPVVTKAQAIELPKGEEGARFLDQVDVVMRYLETAKGYYATQLTLDPTYDLPGYAMVPGAIRREIRSENWEAARQRLAEWLEMDEINGAANYRLMDLERALGKKLGLRGKELKERMNAILQGLVEERPNAASLKRIKGNGRIKEFHSEAEPSAAPA